MVERFFKSRIRMKITPANGIFLALATYLCVNITWVFFRAREFGTAMDMLGSMFFFNHGEKVLQQLDIVKTFIVIAILFLVHWYMRDSSVKELFGRIKWWVTGIVWAVMLFLLIIAQGSGEQFIYFQF